MTDHAEALAKALAELAAERRCTAVMAGRANRAEAELAAYRSRPAAEVVGRQIHAVLAQRFDIGDFGDDGGISKALAGLFALLATPAVAGTEPAGEVVEDLDSRMKAAGMIPLSDLLSGNTPMEKWMAHTAVRDLETFGQWLDMRHREFMTMRVAYDLGDKDKSDELYEWVFAHAGAFGEVAANFRAMKERSAALRDQSEA